MNFRDPHLKKTAECIGEKMRLMRNSRGLTQRELSMGAVSRNMLSMIESGNALPSIETLLHISNVLAVPAGYFFAEGDEEKLYEKKEAISAVSSFMSENKYAEAATVCEPYIDTDGEMRLYYSLSHLYIAEDLLERFMLTSAYDHLKKAVGTASLIPLIGGSIASLCHFVMKLIDYVGNDDIPEELTDFDNLGDTVMPTSCVLYLTAYKSIKNNDPDCASAMLRTGLLSSFHSLHIRGAVLMVSGDFDGATRLFDLALSSDDGGFFSRYKLLCDLEFCRKSAGDFEAAYSLSTSRMEMLGMFSK
ncbi:MAG: helix-turn-helix transcriptional regulator [Ruminococcaceae bacterium]|nr:helix-turn-helix transcriptional regulator [Oscillospiraceae bacterium]